jgi:proteinaceous RNase P
MTADTLPAAAAAATAAATPAASPPVALAAAPQPSAARKRPAADRPAAATKEPRTARARQPPPPDVALRLAVHTAAKAQDPAAALAAFDAAVSGPSPPVPDPPADVCNTVLYLCAGGDEWDAGLEVLGAPKAGKRRAEGGGVGAGAAAVAAAAAAPAPPAPPPPPALVLDPATLAARGREVFARVLEAATETSASGLTTLRPRDGEMAHTSLARLAARVGDRAGALAAARAAVAAGLPPRLRTWTPALYAAAAAGAAAEALAVDAELGGHGLCSGEAELAALAGAAATSGGGGRGAPLPPGALASVLARLSREHGSLQPETLDAVEALFNSPAAGELLPAAGGGEGARRWAVSWTDPHPATGALPPSAGGGALAPADLAPAEWADFAGGVAALATERARRPADFEAFAEWLKGAGPFEAVIDGANVALFGQNWEHGGFDWGQVGAVLDALARERGVVVAPPPPAAGSGGGDPPPPTPPRVLLILHRSRAGGPPAASPIARRILASLGAAKCFYAAPHGSNDDWYWLYACLAAGERGLLISNDEMRDHVFQLLSPAFFARWKGRHQVRYEVGPGGGGAREPAPPASASPPLWGPGRHAALHFPPPYSACAQQVAGSGAWLFPAMEPPVRGQWLCARPVGDEGGDGGGGGEQ